MAASEALAGANRPEDLAEGRIYPGLSDVRSISVRRVGLLVVVERVEVASTENESV